jgi:hypothetical protein
LTLDSDRRALRDDVNGRISDLKTRAAIARLLRDVDADRALSFDTKINLLLPLAARANARTGRRGWVLSFRSPPPWAFARFI